ncbi:MULTISPECIES: hypothetical protein [unclassified Sphingomonas]|uniref:hypothetical protein n=1 Tax=unclassified Sphingomonas TaxID=196159 RepID=UPI000B0D975C|nr:MULTISPECIES: hypothetical protein [unclassified Sphingomonas]
MRCGSCSALAFPPEGDVRYELRFQDYQGSGGSYYWNVSQILLGLILNERFPVERVTIDRALAHAGKKEADVNVKVEGAYNRSKQIRARRRLMQIWADLLFPAA